MVVLLDQGGDVLEFVLRKEEMQTIVDKHTAKDDTIAGLQSTVDMLEGEVDVVLNLLGQAHDDVVQYKTELDAMELKYYRLKEAMNNPAVTMPCCSSSQDH